MNRKIFLTILVFIALILGLPKQAVTLVSASEVETEYNQSTSIEAKVIDNRALVLQSYLASHNSPMQYNAQDFIEAADKYGVDWKLVPAIAGVESTFGKHVPGGTDPQHSSFNAYGWGVYGTNAIYFESWREGIYTLNEGLKTKYIDRGYKTPAQMNKIYAASPTWGAKVTFFIEKIDNYTKEYEQRQDNSRLGILLSNREMKPSPKEAVNPDPIAVELAFR